MLVAVLGKQLGKRGVIGLVLLGLLALSAVWLVISVGGVTYLGQDFRCLYLSAKLIAGGETAAIYDLEAQAALPLAAPIINWPGHACPMLYPVAFVLPLVPLAALSPAVSYYIWTGTSLLLMVLGLYWLCFSLRLPFWPSLLFTAGFLPLAQGVVIGQVYGFIFLTMVGFFLSLRGGKERSAGLWLSGLLLKPQYLPLLLVMLAWKGRWPVLIPFLGATLGVAIVSAIVVGPEGVKDYIGLLMNASSLQGIETNSPSRMVNWRALGVNLFGSEHSNAVLGGVIVLSGITAALALLPWRALSWDQLAGAKLHLIMLGVLAATLITAYHSHTHGLVLMLVPLFAALKSAPERVWLRDIVGFGPSLALWVWAATLAPLEVPSEVTNLAMLGILACVVVLVAVHSRQGRAAGGGGVGTDVGAPCL